MNPLIENNVCIILAGCSGGGKSTFADFLEFMIDDCEIVNCCADDYFIQDGEYKFDVTKLGAAHRWCQEKADSAMLHSVRVVLISNTSTTLKERNIYKNMAEKYGYKVVELILNGGFKDVHGVPTETLKRQKEKLINSLL